MTTTYDYDLYPDLRRRTWSPSAAASIHRAWRLFQVCYAALAILAGLDKFAQILVDWPMYLAPSIASILPVSPVRLMFGVGALEIVLGLMVALRPRIGGALLGLWLLATAFNLFLHPGGLLDIMLRDLVLALGAFGLAALSRGVDIERI
jgi:hypothetical protein